jgi:two-component system phosphate regulon sensor histidine kinase PhoR
MAEPPRPGPAASEPPANTGPEPPALDESELDEGWGDDPAERPGALRRKVLEASVFRGLALAAAAGMLLIVPASSVPWLATLLSLLVIGFIVAGWRVRGYRALRQTDPVHAARVADETARRSLLDAISSPTILVDHRGHVVHANASARGAFGGLRQGQPFSFSVRAPAVVAALDKVLRADNEARAEFSERVPVERSYDVTFRRLGAPGAPESRSHGVPFALVMLTETTAARRVEQMRADFVANASHELRTPLASILGFVETLQGAAKDDAQARKSFLGIMEVQARRMSRLIDDLLSLSKIEMTAHIPPAGKVDLALALRSVRDALGGLARDRGVAIEMTIPEGDWNVPGDRDELVRVFENLIENAIKYGQSGGRAEVTLAADTDAALGRVAIVAVRDFGPGIAEEHLPRLTERFYRADIGESRVLGGTGLGLAIVKHIVTRHRGRLSIASRLGDGATFSVTLPADRVN